MQLRLSLLMILLSQPVWAADYACLIEPRQTLKLAASVQGVVASLAVDRGDPVHKGQLVAELDSEVERANVLIARLRAGNTTEVESSRAKMEFLKRKVARAESLRATSFVAASAIDEASSDARVAEAQMHEQQLNLAQSQLEAKRAEGLLRQRQVFSPVDGVVTEVALGVGEFRNDQAHILTVAELDPLRIEAFLPIAAYGHVKPGDALEVLPEAPVGGVYQAKVTVVDRVFDAASDTIGVRLELPNPGLALPAGIHCRLRLKDLP